ncbi:MAG: hypothetical protein IJA90_09150 [Peptococcaceae bacterium]|nr:hypothetical protein [Peptococcaceae bacterium]
MKNDHLSLIWMAYLIDCLDINLGSFNLLPDFLAAILILFFIKELCVQHPELKTLYGFTCILLVVRLIFPVFTILFGMQFGIGDWVPIAVICSVMELYLWYVLFTWIGQRFIEEGMLHNDLYLLRNINLALNAGMFLTLQYVQNNELIIWLLAIGQVILIIWLKLIFGNRGDELRRNELHLANCETKVPDICTDETAHLEILKPE